MGEEIRYLLIIRFQTPDKVKVGFLTNWFFGSFGWFLVIFWWFIIIEVLWNKRFSKFIHQIIYLY